MQVFQAFRPFLHILQVFNMDNFINYDLQIILRSIYKALVIIILLLSLCVVSSLNAWCYFKDELSFVQNVQQISAALGAIQMFVIFMSISKNNHQISDGIESLQTTVKNRTIYRKTYAIDLDQ